MIRALKKALFILKNKTKRLLVRLAFLPTRVSSMSTTWNTIIRGEQSVLRIGDGEIRWMSGDPLTSFETNSPRLQNTLMNAVRIKDARLLVCINEKLLMRRLRRAPEYIVSYYKQYVSTRWRIIIRSFPKWRRYGDACISHFYRETKGLSQSVYRKHFDMIKRTWEKKRVLVVEGVGCRFGIGNDLLNAASSVVRVLCPDKNSFDVIDRIKETVHAVSDQFDICLFVLGPTATVLVSELYSELPNKRFLDIGTLDTDYMCFLYGSKHTCSIEHKNIWGTSSADSVLIRFDFDKQGYEKQVLYRIGFNDSNDVS